MGEASMSDLRQHMPQKAGQFKPLSAGCPAKMVVQLFENTFNLINDPALSHSRSYLMKEKITDKYCSHQTDKIGNQCTGKRMPCLFDADRSKVDCQYEKSSICNPLHGAAEFTNERVSAIGFSWHQSSFRANRFHSTASSVLLAALRQIPN